MSRLRKAKIVNTHLVGVSPVNWPQVLERAGYKTLQDFVNEVQAEEMTGQRMEEKLGVGFTAIRNELRRQRIQLYPTRVCELPGCGAEFIPRRWSQYTCCGDHYRQLAALKAREENTLEHAHAKGHHRRTKNPCLWKERGVKQAPNCTGDRGTNMYLCQACVKYNTEGEHNPRCDGEYIYDYVGEDLSHPTDPNYFDGLEGGLT